MGRFERKGFNIFDRISSLFVFILGLIGSITFWVFIAQGDVFDSWYPLVGMLVASHGALIGIIFYEIMHYTGKTFIELFKKKH